MKKNKLGSASIAMIGAYSRTRIWAGVRNVRSRGRKQ